jgi:fluoride exporter
VKGRANVPIAVGCGAGIGALLRYLLAGVAAGPSGSGAMVGTLVVNVVGSFAIAVFAELTDPSGRFPLGETARYFAMAGLCGGFTTFSALSLETYLSLREGEILAGTGTLVAVIALSLAAAAAGHALAIRLDR